MPRLFYVGDFVSTPEGQGHIVEVTSYVDVIRTMTEAEAKEFNEACLFNCGEGFQEKWQKVQVLHEHPRGITKWFEAREVVLIAGRPGA